MKAFWRLFVILFLWPVWYPLAILLLFPILAGGGTKDHTRLQLWRHACYMAMVVLGARDSK